jgi:CDP-diacylglycerol--glycerol-3-phosphate 3-phosphatidyltransferase
VAAALAMGLQRGVDVVDESTTLEGSALLAHLKTTPNLITLSRLCLVFGVIAAYFAGAYSVGVVLGAIAGATDYLDGWYARRTGQVTRLGEILDQFCDILLELTFLVFAVSLGVMSVIVIVPYFVREIWVVMLRRYSIEYGENIPSSLVGKLKASFVGWSMLPLLIGGVGMAGSYSHALVRFGQLAFSVGLLLTLVSGIQYTISFVRIYDRHARKGLDPTNRPA